MTSIDRKILIILLFLVNMVYAQDFPVDSSFTLNADFQKQIKYYPNIQPVWPQLGANVIRKADIVYAKYDERELHLDLFLPKNQKQATVPLVILLHGGGWASGNKTMEAPMANYLAEQGYIAATIEYRLSPEALYPSGLIDIKTAIRWLRKNAANYGINAKQFAIYGTSSGGQMAALIGTTGHSGMYVDSMFYPEFSSAVQAIVDVDGVLCFIHPESGEGADKPGKPSAATRWFGGNNEQKTLLWNEASALYHTDENTPPILFINSQHPRFHAGRNDMARILDSLKIYSEIHTLPETPHTFWLYDAWFFETANYTLNFLNKVFQSK